MDPDPDHAGLPPKFNQLFTGPLTIFPENFMQIRSDVFAQSCEHTNTQTNNDDYISSTLGGGNNLKTGKDSGRIQYTIGFQGPEV